MQQLVLHQPFSTAFCSSLAKLYNSSGRLLLKMLKLSNGFLTVQEVPEDKKNKVQQIFFLNSRKGAAYIVQKSETFFMIFY